MANKRESALTKQSKLLDKRGQTAIDDPDVPKSVLDSKKITRETERRVKSIDGKIEAPTGGGGGGAPKQPERKPPPFPKIIDRLHKWGRSYVVLSKDHFIGDDPIHNPAYANGELASSLEEALAKCTYLMEKMTSNDERCVLMIWGGVWEEQLLIDQNRLDVLGFGDPIIANPDASFRPFEISIPAVGPVPTFGQTIKGIKFVDRFGNGAAQVASFQTGPSYPQMLRLKDCEFHSLGATAFVGAGGFSAKDCLFNQLSTAPAMAFVPTVKVEHAAVASRCFAHFDDCKMMGRMFDNRAMGLAITATSRPSSTSFPVHELVHDTGLLITNSEMFGTVQIEGWNAEIARTGIYSDFGVAHIQGGIGLRLYGKSSNNDYTDEINTPANVTLDQCNVRAYTLAKVIDEKTVKAGVIARIRFNQSSHQVDSYGHRGAARAAVEGDSTGTGYHVTKPGSSTHCDGWSAGFGTEDGDGDTISLPSTSAENPYPKNFW